MRIAMMAIINGIVAKNYTFLAYKNVRIKTLESLSICKFSDNSYKEF